GVAERAPLGLAAQPAAVGRCRIGRSVWTVGAVGAVIWRRRDDRRTARPVRLGGRRAGLVGATGGEDTGRGEGDGEDASGAHAGWTSRRSRLVPVDRRRRSAWRLRELEQVAVRIVHEGL